MQETELHDYGTSIQQGSSSMMRSDSSKRSSSSEPECAALVYFKDNVTIHPTQLASERISGRLKLIKQASSLFMTWIPYKGQNSTSKLSEKDRNLYTIRAVPFTEVRSIRRHTPALGWQYIIVVLSSGLAFPPLYFYTGGVRGFLATVKQHVFLVRSAEDANVFLVNDFENPLQRTLSSLELPRVVSVASGSSTPISVGDSPTNMNQERINGGLGHESHSISQFNGRQRQNAHDPARGISIQVLEKFSLVTKLARETTSHLFRENHSSGFGAFEKKFDRHSALDFDHNTSNHKERILDEIPIAPDPVEKISPRKQIHNEEAVTNVGSFELIDCKEFDKLTLVWGKPRQPPLGSEEDVYDDMVAKFPFSSCL